MNMPTARIVTSTSQPGVPMHRHIAAFAFALVLVGVPAAALAEEPAQETQASVEVVTDSETFGPIDVRLSLVGYRVRLDHHQVEAIVGMSEYAELAANWAGSDLVAQIVWLARAQLAAVNAIGGHAGVEVSGGWSDIPSIVPR